MYPLLISTVFSIFKDTYFCSKKDINMDSNKEIMSKLKFIGKIQKGEKINVKYMYLQPEGVMTRISRTLVNQCNRQNTLNFVRNTIERTFEILTNVFPDTKNNTKKNVIEDLKAAKTGISNLKETYLSDTKFCCDLDTLLQDIDNKLIEFLLMLEE